MNSMNEADTRAKLIDPKIRAAGWGESQIEREHYFRKGGEQLTAGRIYLVGHEARRGKPKKVDYLFRYKGMPIAVLEAKKRELSPGAGLEQAKEYADLLDVPFAYSSNGELFVEHDFLTHQNQDLGKFPSPEELWIRWNSSRSRIDDMIVKDYRQDSEPGFEPDPLLHPYCPPEKCGNITPRYFQEVAIRRTIERIVTGQRRMLLAMATGTGKTFIAFQIAWKLFRSGWLKRNHPGKPGRILFLADRLVLRRQAYNRFSAFAEGSIDPRHIIKGHPPRLTRDIYFAIYQTLWSEDERGSRLFEKFPRDFFDLVIIDECHRSGYGRWKEILDHFNTAIHLGMTATPKREDNIDTYEYFCKEETDVPIDPDDLGKGTRKPAAYEYSLGQGIEDGFLATYRVHRVRTTVDAKGFHMIEAIEQGAEVTIPEDTTPKEVYYTPEFEREITLPDRTKRIVEHLANRLKQFGHMDKTMVFCVDMEHAQLVVRLLQNEFADLGYDDYAVPIISEEGERAREWLRSFADSDKRLPVVATTAELLSTGVDVPSCKNIVFIKTVASPVVFKQIIGRGSRVDPTTDKLWFRIIDYTGATRLFDEWDRPPIPKTGIPEGPRTAAIKGRIISAEDGLEIVGAYVSWQFSPNQVLGPVETNEEGRFFIGELPEGRVQITATATGFVSRSIIVQTIPDETFEIEIALKKPKKRKKIRVEGLEVQIADEAVFLVEATNQQLTFEEYTDYTRRILLRAAPSLRDLRKIWIDPERRKKFLAELVALSIHPELIARLMDKEDIDMFDFLAYLAFGRLPRSRDERAEAFINREQAFIKRHAERARLVIRALLEKYRRAGIEEIADAKIFSVTPFSDMGGATRIIDFFGGPDKLHKDMKEIQKRLYPKENNH